MVAYKFCPELPFDSSTALVPILAGISPKKAGGGGVISN